MAKKTPAPKAKPAPAPQLVEDVTSTTDATGTDTLSAEEPAAAEAPVVDLTFTEDQIVSENYVNDALKLKPPAEPGGDTDGTMIDAVGVELTLKDGRKAYGLVAATGNLAADQAAAKASAAIPA